MPYRRITKLSDHLFALLIVCTSTFLLFVACTSPSPTPFSSPEIARLAPTVNPETLADTDLCTDVDPAQSDPNQHANDCRRAYSNGDQKART